MRIVLMVLKILSAIFLLNFSSVMAAINLDMLAKAPTHCNVSKQNGKEVYDLCRFAGLNEVYGQNIYLNSIFSGNISNFYFSEFNLQNPSFSQLHKIENSYFIRGLISNFKFENVTFNSVDFASTSFRNGSFFSANFEKVNLSFSSFRDISLKNIRFRDVDTFMAEFSGVDFSATTGLQQSDFDRACGSDRTVLPRGIARPAHWPCNAVETAVVRLLQTHIHSGSDIHWHGSECAPISDDFRALREMAARPENIYRRYPLSYSQNEMWSVHIFPHNTHRQPGKLLGSGNVRSDCKRFYVYTKRSSAPSEYIFAAQIDCIAGICSMSGAGSPNSPGQIGRIEVTLNYGVDVAKFKEYLLLSGASEIEPSDFADRAQLRFTFPATDLIFLVLLQHDSRVWHAARLSDAIGGDGSPIFFKEKGVLQELVLEASGKSLREAALKLITKVFPPGTKISQRKRSHENWFKFELTEIKNFSLERKNFWERYMIDICFVEKIDPPMAVMFLQGEFAPGVGSVPPRAGYTNMKNRYDGDIDELVKLFEQAAQGN